MLLLLQVFSSCFNLLHSFFLLKKMAWDLFRQSTMQHVVLNLALVSPKKNASSIMKLTQF